MCGIYLTNNKLDENRIKQKLNLIKHRGPDNQGIRVAHNIGFGHNRLSIIDLEERANQPMFFEDLTIVYNGEIYNYLDIKKELQKEGVVFTTTSDTEVLIKGYHVWGEKVLQKINGMFVFAIFDQAKNSIFVARDRLGVKPLYYSWEDGKLELCSQLSPMETNGKLDHLAIGAYLQTGYIPSPRSIYNDIKKLSPGTYAFFDLNKKNYKTYTYWDLNQVKSKKIPYEQAKDELHKLLLDAVKIRLQADVPYGCFLSGGIDSALVSSLASKVLDSPLKTLTIGFQNKDYDESSLAQKFSEILGTQHKNTICSEKELLNLLDDFFKVYDEPFSDSSAIPSLLLNKITKPIATVVLSGDGGDESFLGYNHFAWVKKAEFFFFLPLFVRKAIAFFVPFNWLGKRAVSLKNIFKMKSLDNFIISVFSGFESLMIKTNADWIEPYLKYILLSKNKLQKTADLGLKLWLENDSNVKVDRASMAYSVEVRSPFLDYRIIEFARSLPVSFRFSKGIRKRILKDILEEYIPKSIFDVPKKGFSVPLADWIRGSLKEKIKSEFSSNHFDKIPNLDTKKLHRYLKLHLENKGDYSLYIWRAFVLSTWIKKNKVSL
tara:strand:- start:10911 stop:12719 length:1809 start_codon:yes stop_codon:yes gene_type:complete